MLAASFYVNVLNGLVILTGLILIGVVLIQRGKGGGLAGAFGGVGGSSPFGSKAGDSFTRFTIYVAIAWGSLILLQVWAMNSKGNGDVALPGVSSSQ